MIEYILIGVGYSAENVVFSLLKRREDYGFRYIIPKLKSVPKKRLTKYIVQWIYNNQTPDYISYSNFFYDYQEIGNMAVLKDIAVILNRPVYIIDKYTIR